MTCSRFEDDIVEAWPDLSIRPELRDHLGHCERCASVVRRHAMVANCLEGIQVPPPSMLLSQRIKSLARTTQKKPLKRWRSVVVLLAVAFLGMGDANRSNPRILETQPAPRASSGLSLVDTQTMTEQGNLAISRARAAFEPITQATASAISRVLYEMTEPLLLIDRS